MTKLKNQTFHYTCRITPKRVTSWPCLTPYHSARQHSYLCRCWSGGEPRLQRCLRFGRPSGNELSTRTRGTRVNLSAYIACLHDQNKNGFFGGPAFFQRIRSFWKHFRYFWLA